MNASRKPKFFLVNLIFLSVVFSTDGFDEKERCYTDQAIEDHQWYGRLSACTGTKRS